MASSVNASHPSPGGSVGMTSQGSGSGGSSQSAPTSDVGQRALPKDSPPPNNGSMRTRCVKCFSDPISLVLLICVVASAIFIAAGLLANIHFLTMFGLMAFPAASVGWCAVNYMR